MSDTVFVDILVSEKKKLSHPLSISTPKPAYYQFFDVPCCHGKLRSAATLSSVQSAMSLRLKGLHQHQQQVTLEPGYITH